MDNVLQLKQNSLPYWITVVMAIAVIYRDLRLCVASLQVALQVLSSHGFEFSSLHCKVIRYLPNYLVLGEPE